MHWSSKRQSRFSLLVVETQQPRNPSRWENSLVLNIELKMHATNKVLIGQNYVGAPSASLNIMSRVRLLLLFPILLADESVHFD